MLEHFDGVRVKVKAESPELVEWGEGERKEQSPASAKRLEIGEKCTSIDRCKEIGEKWLISYLLELRTGIG